MTCSTKLDGTDPVDDFLLDEFALAAVFEAGKLLVGRSQFLVARFEVRIDGSHAESRGRLSVDHELHDALEFVHVDKVAIREVWSELLGEEFRILRPDFVRKECSHVTEDGVFEVDVGLRQRVGLVQLSKVLVRDHEAQAVFAGFGEDGFDGVGDVVLELVDIEEEILTILLLHGLATHGRDLHFGNHHHAEELRIEVPEDAFGQVDEEDLLVLHDVEHVEGRLGLADDVAHHGVRDEPAELRLEVRDDFGFFTIAHLGVGEVPPCLYDGVFERAAAFFLEFVVGKETDDVGQRGAARVVHEGEDAVSEVVLDAGPEDLVTEELDHHVHRVLRDHLLFVGSVRLEQVQPHRARKVGRIEIDDVVGTFARNERHEVAREVAVRVHDADAVPQGNVLPCQYLDDARFTGTGLTDDVEMAEPVFGFDADFAFHAAVIVVPDEDAFGGNVHRRFHDLEVLPADFRRGVVFGMRKMEERSDLFDGEDLLLTEPFAREIAENVSAEELVRIMGPMGFETVVRRSGKLRKRSDDIVKLGLGENLVARGDHDSYDRFETGFLRLLAYEFLTLTGVFFVVSSFFVVGFEENREHRSKNARHDVLVVSAYVVSLFERLTLPIVRNGPNENLHDRGFVFGKLSKNAGNRVNRVGFEFLVGSDGKERVFVENHLGTRRNFARPEDVGLRNFFDDGVGIKTRNLLFDKNPRLSGNRHVKEDFAVLGDVFERYAVRAEEFLADAAFGKAA